MRKNKKLTMILTMCLVAVISIGATYAALGVKTNEEVNKFNVAGDDAFDAKLVEDGFTDAEKEKAKKVVPGAEINKDPKIENISTEAIDGWVAMRMVLRKGDTTLAMTAADIALLNRVLDIQINYTDWERKTGSTTDPFTETEIFYYRQKISPGTQTAALFSKVSIKTTATNADLEVIRDTWNGFDIVLMGAGVQDTTGATLATVKADLDSLLQ